MRLHPAHGLARRYRSLRTWNTLRHLICASIALIAVLLIPRVEQHGPDAGVAGLAAAGGRVAATAAANMTDLAYGRCNNSQDLDVISERKDALKGDVQLCSLKCLLRSHASLLQCLQGIGFSPSCAECW
eukprot:CAMPEP_0115262242 /NCGR_PEP_ID=MMETSP0270-20121206/49280_1 /TAXON_ID=71861 /ORGANISM="Scrippsiella trochoidea, Strain CCMP3099" /LENGTH=128 /DNA_ID=CAMNT_0002678159 /DNA_START=127 /DNA_END=510 /DNA_ORIENTATION=-